MRIEALENMVKRQVVSKGPTLLRRALSEGVKEIVVAGFALSKKFTPKEEDKDYIMH